LFAAAAAAAAAAVSENNDDGLQIRRQRIFIASAVALNDIRWISRAANRPLNRYFFFPDTVNMTLISFQFHNELLQWRTKDFILDV